VPVPDVQVRLDRRQRDDGHRDEEKRRLSPDRQTKASERQGERQRDQGGDRRLHREADREVGAEAGGRVLPEEERVPRLRALGREGEPVEVRLGEEMVARREHDESLDRARWRGVHLRVQLRASGSGGPRSSASPYSRTRRMPRTASAIGSVRPPGEAG